MAPRATRHIPVASLDQPSAIVYPDKKEVSFTSISVHATNKDKGESTVPEGAAYGGYETLEVLFWIDKNAHPVATFLVQCPTCWTPRNYLNTLLWLKLYDGCIKVKTSFTPDQKKFLSLNLIEHQFPFLDDVDPMWPTTKTTRFLVEGGEDCFYQVTPIPIMKLEPIHMFQRLKPPNYRLRSHRHKYRRRCKFSTNNLSELESSSEEEDAA